MPIAVDAGPVRSARDPRHAVVLPTAPQHLRMLRKWLGGVLAVYLIALQLASAVGHVVWEWPLHVEATWSSGPAGLAFAALRAVPLGYLAAFGVRRRRALRLAGVGAAVVEIGFQLLETAGGRVVQLVAPLAALGGALVGAAGFLVVGARMRARAANDAAILAPDLPLVGGAYLATPLLWLASDAEASSVALRGGWCALLLALFGASLLASVRSSRGAAGGGILAHAGVAVVWCAVGMAPLILAAPVRTAVTIGLVAIFAALHPASLGVRGRDRRVEGPALRRAMPLLLCYAVLSALAPLAAARAGAPGAWSGWLSIEAAAAPAGWAEPIALFTLLGYVVAEWRGRREEMAGTAWRRLAAPIVLAAAVVAGLRVAATPAGSPPTMRAAVVLVAATGASVVAARVGMSLYAVQRGYARAHARRGMVVGGVTTPRRRSA